MLKDIPSKISSSPGKYAVMLNARAKRWTGTLHAEISRWVPAQDLFLTEDFRQAERTVDRLIREGYQTIFTAGGDGTIMYLLNAIENRIRSGQVERSEAPKVGVLKMGTGNAIASYLGSGDIISDLRRLRAGAPLITYEVGMIEGIEGLYPFAGFGLDALILNDYDAIKEMVQGRALENYVTGLSGYALAVGTRSIPTALRQKEVPVEFVNNKEAFQIDAHGNVLREFKAGETIFEGRVKIFGVGSIGNWGFDLQMFPQCHRKPGFFQLRTFDGSILWILKNLNRFWKGELQEGHHWDFLCNDVTCTILEGSLPYQVAGDAQGYQRGAHWKSPEFPVQLAVAYQD